ncbi:MAG TPA: TRAP transporter small permease [Thermodesulfobacteriota bacterium]
MSGPGRAITRIEAAVGRAVEGITWVLTGVLVLLVSVNVFARYTLGIGWISAEEVSRLLFVWVVFLGSYVALRRKQHVAMDFVAARVPRRALPAFLTVTRLFVLAFLGVLAWSGIELVCTTLELGRVTPILGISAAWGYLGVPVSAILMFLEVLRETLAGEVPST